jgi:hypothetical protein
VDTSLPESELAADRAEKDALLKDGQAIVAAAEKLIAETKVRGLCFVFCVCGGVGRSVGGGSVVGCGVWGVGCGGGACVFSPH